MSGDIHYIDPSVIELTDERTEFIKVSPEVVAGLIEQVIQFHPKYQEGNIFVRVEYGDFKSLAQMAGVELRDATEREQ